MRRFSRVTVQVGCNEVSESGANSQHSLPELFHMKKAQSPNHHCFARNAANADALQAAVSYLRVIALFYILCFTGNAFVGYLDGIGKVQYPFIGAASHITLRILLSYLLIGRMGLAAVALASGLGWVWANFFWTVVIRRVGDSSFHVK